MQLIVNGSQTHVLQVAPEANVAQLRAQLSMLEGVDCEQVNGDELTTARCNFVNVTSFNISAQPLLLRISPRG